MKALVVSLLVGVLVPVLALAQQDRADLNTISSVRVSGSTVEIGGTKKPNFTTFTMTDPPRLVIDISEAVFAGVPEELPGSGTVTGIRTASYGSDQNAIARILIGYDREVETDIAASGNQLVVKVVGGAGTLVAEAPRAAAAQPAGTTGTPAGTTGTPAGTTAARTEPGTGAAQAAVAARDDRAAQEKAAAEAAAAARNDRTAQEKAAAEAAAAARLAAETERKQKAEAERVAAESRREAEAQAARAAAEDKKRQEAEARAAAAAEKKRQEDELRAAAEAKKQAEADERERRRQAALAAAEAKKQAEADARERKRQEAAAAAEDKKQRQEEARAAAEAKRQAEADARAMAAADKRRQQEEARAARPPRVAQAEPTPRAEPRAARPVGGSDAGLNVSSRGKTMTLVGFQQQPSTSRVFVRTNEPVRYSVSESDNQVVLELENTRIDMSNNTLPLDTSFFETAVSRVNPEPGEGRSVRVVIQLKEPVSFQTRQEGNLISLEFQRPSR